MKRAKSKPIALVWCRRCDDGQHSLNFGIEAKP